MTGYPNIHVSISIHHSQFTEFENDRLPQQLLDYENEETKFTEFENDRLPQRLDQLKPIKTLGQALLKPY